MPSWRKYRDAWQATHPTCRILPVPAEVGQRGWLVVRSSLLHHLIGDHRFPILGPGQPAPFAAIRPRQPPPGQEVDEAVEPGREPPEQRVHFTASIITTWGAIGLPRRDNRIFKTSHAVRKASRKVVLGKKITLPAITSQSPINMDSSPTMMMQFLISITTLPFSPFSPARPASR